MKWQNIRSAPKSGIYLIRFESGHIEDASFHKTEDGHWYYALYDGESLTENPTHWMPLPEPPK